MAGVIDPNRLYRYSLSRFRSLLYRRKNSTTETLESDQSEIEATVEDRSKRDRVRGKTTKRVNISRLLPRHITINIISRRLNEVTLK